MTGYHSQAAQAPVRRYDFLVLQWRFGRIEVVVVVVVKKVWWRYASGGDKKKRGAMKKQAAIVRYFKLCANSGKK